MKLYEEFVSRQEIFHGRIVDLRVDTVRLPNGHLTTREVIDFLSSRMALSSSHSALESAGLSSQRWYSSM